MASSVDDVDLGEDSEDDGGMPSLEKKYKQFMRQIVTQKIDLPVSALLQMLDDQVKINPEFQRRERWDTVRQSRLIESLVMNVPIPPVFLGEDEYGHYVVLDGRQRLTAVSKFLKNDLTLCGLEVWEELNSLNYQGMIKLKLEKYFTRRFIPAVVILKESSPAVKYDVFDRLNTGGVQANAMEIRNALYRGRFSDLIHKLSRNRLFCLAWEIPFNDHEAENNKLYSEMKDLELVLRFFAIRDLEQMQVAFKDYLGDYMSDRNKAYETSRSLVDVDAANFENAIVNATCVGRSRVFCRKSERRSVPFSDAVMQSLAQVDSHIVELNKDRVGEALRSLEDNTEFLQSISRGTNGIGAIRTRVSLAKKAVLEALA